jgi:UDP:flavonoid glycosyltransferase YjiC (YdhE family)
LSPARTLFAWELGANLGHVLRDLAVARALRRQGHEVLFAVRDPRTAEEFLTPERFRFVPSPRPVPARMSQPPASYAEILLEYGYADHMTLSGLVREWLNLFAFVRPNALVIDHAPTALLAARIAHLPCVQLGTGFEIPPTTSPLPSIRPTEPIPESRLRLADHKVAVSVNGVLQEHQLAPLARVADLFADAPALLTTFPELDHYGPRADGEYIGPLIAEPTAEPCEWPTDEGPRIVLYMRPGAVDLKALLEALVTIDACSIGVIPQIPEAVLKPLESARLKLSARALSLTPVLRSADLVINYGGAGTIAQSLLAGVPMVLIPESAEQHLGALAVDRLGAALIVPPKSTQDVFTAALRTALDGDRLRSAARSFAQCHADFDVAEVERRAAQVIEHAALG